MLIGTRNEADSYHNENNSAKLRGFFRRNSRNENFFHFGPCAHSNPRLSTSLMKSFAHYPQLTNTMNGTPCVAAWSLTPVQGSERAFVGSDKRIEGEKV